jgi:hypothetical protein
MDLLEWAQFAALVSGALFFLGRAFAGYFIISLTLTLELHRVDARNGLDHLQVDVRLKGGKTGTARIIGGRALCRLRHHKPLPYSLHGVTRVQLHKGKLPLWWPAAESGIPYKLPPDEELQTAVYFAIPSDTVCWVEVLVAARRWRWARQGQWRATALSTPWRQLPSDPVM